MSPETHLRDIRFLSLDLETVGLAPTIDPILEIGGIFFRRSGLEGERFSSLCNPAMPIPRRIQELTGITDAMVADQESADIPIRKLVDHLRASPTVIVAHGVSTDLAFVRANVERMGLQLPPMVAVDTLPLSRKVISDVPDYRLETVARSLFTESGEVHFHRALDDAEQTFKLFLYCLDRLRQSVHTLDDLDRLRVLVRERLDGPQPKPIGARFDRLIAWTREEEVVEINYRGGSQKGRWRTVRPQTFFQRGVHHYLRAWCLLEDIGKDFRLDRIGGYRLPAAPQQSEPEQESKPSPSPGHSHPVD